MPRPANEAGGFLIFCISLQDDTNTFPAVPSGLFSKLLLNQLLRPSAILARQAAPPLERVVRVRSQHGMVQAPG